jgi:hypothetical protein
LGTFLKKEGKIHIDMKRRVTRGERRLINEMREQKGSIEKDELKDLNARLMLRKHLINLVGSL